MFDDGMAKMLEAALEGAGYWREQARAAQAEIATDDALLAERQRLLDSIPDCPEHGGGCVPHAIDWVEAHLDETRLRIKFQNRCDVLENELADARIKGDERDDMVQRAANAATDMARQLREVERERDWLRGVARGLLRAAREQADALREIAEVQSSFPTGKANRAAWRGISALAVLPEGVRKLVEE